MSVIKHGPIHYSFMIFGKMFQVLIVSGNNAKCTFLVETLQYSFGYGTTNLRLCSATEFIDKDKASFVAAFHHYLHIGEMRRVSTQIVFNGLLVTYVYKDIAEDSDVTAFMHGNRHSALHHIL